VILWPLAVALFRTLGLAPPAAAGIAVVTALTVAALTAQLELVAEGRRFWPAALALFAALAALAWGASFTRYSASKPRIANVSYVLDADKNEAYWTVRAEEVVPWLEQFLGPSPRRGSPAAIVPPDFSPGAVGGFTSPDATPASLSAPTATLVSQAASPGGRVLTILVAPAAEGHALSVWTSGAKVVDAAVDGRHVPGRSAQDGTWSLDFLNAPLFGVSITLDCPAGEPLRVAVLDRASGLPSIPGRTYLPRPPDIVPIQFGDQTIVRRTFVF